MKHQPHRPFSGELRERCASSLPEQPEDFIGTRLLRDGIHSLPVSWKHATRVARLPMVHHDPFDRLLVSQAQIEKIALISADPIFTDYDIELIRC